MTQVHKTEAHGRGHNHDEMFRYINVLDIETDEEHERLFQKIKKLVEEDGANN